MTNLLFSPIQWIEFLYQYYFIIYAILHLIGLAVLQLVYVNGKWKYNCLNSHLYVAVASMFFPITVTAILVFMVIGLVGLTIYGMVMLLALFLKDLFKGT